jgi:hypothetical protein
MVRQSRNKAGNYETHERNCPVCFVDAKAFEQILRILATTQLIAGKTLMEMGIGVGIGIGIERKLITFDSDSDSDSDPEKNQTTVQTT